MFGRVWVGEKVCRPSARLRMIRPRQFQKREEVTLVEKNDPFALTREGGVREFPRQQTTGIRHHDERRSELASLSPVNRQGICQLKRRIALLPKVAAAKSVPKTKLQ
jgi:hypothetical protein